jgi:hypothetical protein
MRTLLRLGRATIVTAAILAASGMLETTGRPLFAAIGEVALNLVAVQSETEKLRRKVTGALYRLSHAGAASVPRTSRGLVS